MVYLANNKKGLVNKEYIDDPVLIAKAKAFKDLLSVEKINKI